MLKFRIWVFAEIIWLFLLIFVWHQWHFVCEGNFSFHLKCRGRDLCFSLRPLTNSGSCRGKLLFLGCESISVLVVGQRKFFGTSTSRVLLINVFIDFGFIKLQRAFSIMKGDNFVIGVSSVDSSMINLGKRVWSELLSEPDSACGHFSFVFFFAFISIGIFAEVTDCAPQPPQNPIKRNIKGETHSPWQIRATHSVYSHWGKWTIWNL